MGSDLYDEVVVLAIIGILYNKATEGSNHYDNIR